jgi:hypothetical protein
MSAPSGAHSEFGRKICESESRLGSAMVHRDCEGTRALVEWPKCLARGGGEAHQRRGPRPLEQTIFDGFIDLH